MIDPFKPAALHDGDCEFIAVAASRPLDADVRALRRVYAPRLAVLASADQIVFLARFRAPCPPVRAVGMALWLAREIEQKHRLSVLKVAPLDVLEPMKLNAMDRYRLELSSCGHHEFPTADLLAPVVIPRRDGQPLPIVARASKEGGAA